MVGGLVDLQRQPSLRPPNGSVPLVAQPRGGALRNTNHANDVKTNDFEGTSDRVKEIDNQSAESSSRQRHNCAKAWCDKARHHSARRIVHTFKNNGFAERPEASNAEDFNMPIHFDATTMEDFQCLDPDRTFDLTTPNNETKVMKDSPKTLAPLSALANHRYDQLITLDVDKAKSHVGNRAYSPDSLPEMDSGYSTSESGMSVAEELAAQYFTPGHSLLELLPKDDRGRFGSYYSPTGERKHGLRRWPTKTRTACDDDKRFSSTSSIYSEDGLDPIDAWLTPIPLVIRKDKNEQAPPIPERNPLRKQENISSNERKSNGETKRASRNILNLHLDLPKSNFHESPKSTRSPCKRSKLPTKSSQSLLKTSKSSPKGRHIPSTKYEVHIPSIKYDPSKLEDPSKKEEPRSANRRPHLTLVIPGPSHISQAMRNSVEKAKEAERSKRASNTSRNHASAHQHRDPIKPCRTSTSSNAQSRPRSTRAPARASHSSLSSSTKAQGQNHSTKEKQRQSEKARTLRESQGYARVTSQPSRVGVLSERANKWNETMPVTNTVRKSCIPSLVNDGCYKKRPSQTPAINKRLPPLPPDLKLEVAVRGE